MVCPEVHLSSLQGESHSKWSAEMSRLTSRQLPVHAGADPASKVKGAISVIFGQVSLRFHYCKRVEVQHITCNTSVQKQ